MRTKKQFDLKLLSELLKNAKRSDRELARIFGTSQPTVSRRRAQLEKEVIDSYTVIPKWEKMGYEIFAITLIKSKSELASKEKYNAVRKRGLEWLMKQPNVIMAGGCRGTGINSFMISLHKNYTEFDDFMYRYKLEWGGFMDDTQTIIVNLMGRELLKPFSFKYLAEVTKSS